MTSDLPQNTDLAHVRWWIVGPVTPQPTGRARTLTRDSFSAAFAELASDIEVDVGGALGAAAALPINYRPDKLRAFTLREIVARVPALTQLRDLAEAFGGPASKRPDPVHALTVVEQLVGRGALHRELQTCLGLETAETKTETSATPSPGGGESTADSSVDAILAAGTVGERDEAKSAVDSFVSTMRRTAGGSKGTVSASASASHRKARDLLERRVFAAASSVMANCEAQRLEGLWRGLKLVVDECPAGSILVRLVDVASDDIADALRAIPSSLDDPMEGPDAVFVLGEIDDPTVMAQLAELGTDLDAPIVASGSPELWGCQSLDQLASIADDQGLKAATSGAWGQLREQEATRWLCVVGNRVLVQTEGTGDLRRVVFADAPLAFAAMLSASFAYTGGFARIMGRTGGLKAPGLWDAPVPSGTVSIPTESFVPVRVQTQLANAGIIALGSARNSDTVLASAMPTVRMAADAFPFAAQVLTGRLVRFARWVVSQVPAGCSTADLSRLFADASTVFLFPGMPENSASLEAEPVDDGRAVRLIATVRPELAGIPFEVGFDMPLPSPVTD